MRAAGFVLVGGRSSRMGTDKALLPYRGEPLAVHVASAVLAAAGSVTLVGDRDRYSSLGYPVIPDRIPGNGPLGGVAAAVNAADSWALVVACDMPAIEADYLRTLLAEMETVPGNVECIVPETEAGPEPLCALYHRRALGLLDSFLNHKFLKMREVVSCLTTRYIPATDPLIFANLNTPEDVRAHE